jgi:hypothetical protein
VLETIGDRHDALQEFLQAYTLEPSNPQYRENYQRLLKELRQ